LLLGYHLAGMIFLASTWALLSWRPHNLHLAAGMAVELANQAGRAARRVLCGC